MEKTYKVGQAPWEIQSNTPADSFPVGQAPWEVSQTPNNNQGLPVQQQRNDEIVKPLKGYNNLTKTIGDVVDKTNQDYANAIPNFITEAGRQDNSTSANPVIRTAENALGATASGINTVFAPISNTIKQASDSFADSSVGKAIENNPVSGKLLDLFGGASKKLDEWSKAHPEAARNLNNLLTVGLSATGEDPVGKTGEALKTGANIVTKEAGAISSDVGTLTKPITSKVGGAFSNLKDRISPTQTIDSVVGQIIQGTPEDIAPARKTLTNLDTSNIKTTPDLLNALEKRITSLDTAKSSRLTGSPIYEKPILLKDWEQSIKVGESSVQHNYVQDGLNQLKDYYTKTNDIQNATRISDIIRKGDGENLKDGESGGLTINDVDKIAQEHGRVLNGYNANGELASGLSKQAAENTRVGIKETARSNSGDPAYKAIDSAISETIKTRDLIKDQVDNLNKLQQKIQTRSLGEKIGRLGAQIFNTLGGNAPKGVIEYFIGRGTGLKTLNAIDLQNMLRKNLKTLRKLNSKGVSPAEMEKGLQSIIDNQSTNKASTDTNNQYATNIKANQPAIVGDSANSIKNNNTNIGTKSTTPVYKSQTFNAFKAASDNGTQGGFISLPIKDSISKELSKIDTSPLKVNGKLDLSNSDTYFRLDQLKKIVEKRALNNSETIEAQSLLDKVGIKINKTNFGKK